MRTDILADLRDVCDLLCDPHQIREPRWTWDANRNKKPLPDHVVVLPGLLGQLADIVYPGSPPDNGSGPTARPVPGSRPPLRTDAMSALFAIHCAVARWHMSYCLTTRDTLESSVRQLLGRVAQEDSDTQAALLTEMRSWQRQAEIICGWRQPDPQLQVPCPVEGCGERRLRVNLTDRSARCEACGARWGEQEDEWTGSIGVLAGHIAAYQKLSKKAADGARLVERERKQARSGRVQPAV